MSQIEDFYHKEVVPKLIETFQYKNRMQVPKFEKIVLNMGMGCLLYTSPSPRDRQRSRMPSSA